MVHKFNNSVIHWLVYLPVGIIFEKIFAAVAQNKDRFSFSSFVPEEWNIEQWRLTPDQRSIQLQEIGSIASASVTYAHPPAEDPLSAGVITDLRSRNEPFHETPRRSRFHGKLTRSMKKSELSIGSRGDKKQLTRFYLLP